jgi:hypothetical protein
MGSAKYIVTQDGEHGFCRDPNALENEDFRVCVRTGKTALRG